MATYRKESDACVADFIQVCREEYVDGQMDRSVTLGDMDVDKIDTSSERTYFLTPRAGLLWPGGAPNEMILDRFALMQLCQRMKPGQAKLDHNYILACSPGLALVNLKFWMKTWEEREVLLRLKQDPNGRTEVRAALSGAYQIIDAIPVAKKIEPILRDKLLEFVVTKRKWSITFWEELGRTSGSSKFDVGFRVLGSEVGLYMRIMMDVLMKFETRMGTFTVPILQNGKHLAVVPHSGSGMAALGRLETGVAKGKGAVRSAEDAVSRRKTELLKYPMDEFLDVVDMMHLPKGLASLVNEHPEKFEPIKTRFDLACLLGGLASETTGRAQLKIETAAGLYLLTGRARKRPQRGETKEEAESSDDKKA